MILDSLWKMQLQVDETFALNAEPSQSFYRYVKVCKLVAIAVERDLMGLKLTKRKVHVVDWSQ